MYPGHLIRALPGGRRKLFFVLLVLLGSLGNKANPQDARMDSGRPAFICGTCKHGEDPATPSRQVLAGALDRRIETLRVLVIRVDYEDLPGARVTKEEVLDLFNGPQGVSEFFWKSSYKTVRLEVTESDVTEVLRMPKTPATYVSQIYGTMLAKDAIAEAQRAGMYPDYHYQRVVVVSAGIGFRWAGEASRTACVINGYFNFQVVAHELGHTFGVRHAGAWFSHTEDPIGDGTIAQYGDPLDVMGRGSGWDADLNPFFKYLTGWLPAGNIKRVTGPGVYRVFRFDHPDAPITSNWTPGPALALRVARHGDIDYWISYRRGRATSAEVGAYVVWGSGQTEQWGAARQLVNDSLVLNLNGADVEHPLLLFGRSFEDREAGIRFKVVGHGGEGPDEYLDIDVHYPAHIGIGSGLDLFGTRLLTPYSGWFGVRDVSHDGKDSARSGYEASYRPNSEIRVAVTGPGGLTFWWRTSSVPDENWLKVFLDGREQQRICGELPWQYQGIVIPEGTHEVSWRYESNVASFAAADCGWVDEVKFSSNPVSNLQSIEDLTVAEPPWNIPFRLFARASSGLPVEFSVLEGPALVVGGVVTPVGEGLIRVQMSQPGNFIYSPATPVERVFPVLPSSTTMGADIPQMSVDVGDGTSGYVKSIAFQEDGKMVVAGRFSHIGGVPRSNIARFNVDGSLDETWAPNITGGAVTRVLIDRDTAYACGDFVRVNEWQYNGLVQIALTNSSVTRFLDYGLAGSFADMVAQDDTFIFIGNFATWSDFEPRRAFLSKLNGEGTWSPRVNGPVQCLALHGNDLYIAGVFTELNGFPVKQLARLEASGRAKEDRNWLPQGLNEASIRVLAVNESALFVGRDWTPGDSAFDQYGLIKLSTADGSVLGAACLRMSVKALTLHGEHLYVAWSGEEGDSTPSRGLVRMTQAELAVDPSWNPYVMPATRRASAAGEVFTVTARGSDVYAAGSFASVGAGSSAGFGILPILEGAPLVTDIVTYQEKMSVPARVRPHPSDALETSHYRIASIQHGELFRADGQTPLTVGEFITVEEGRAGLRFLPEPGFVGEGEFAVQASLRMHPMGLGGEETRAVVRVIGRSSQSITFEEVPSQVYGVESVPLLATASSGLPVSFRVVSGDVRLENGRLVQPDAGMAIIEAGQNGDAAFGPAIPVRREVVIEKASQTIDFAVPAEIRFGTEPMELSAVASSGLPASILLLSGPATFDGRFFTSTAPGSAELVASQPGDANHHPADAVYRSIRITRALQDIDFMVPDVVSFGSEPFDLTVVASSGLPVSLSVESGPGILLGSRLSLSGAGVLTINALQSGNEIFEEVQARKIISVQKSRQFITIDLPEVVRVTDGPVEIRATASSNLPLSYEVDGPALMEGTSLHLREPGTVLIRIWQDGNSDYEPTEVILRTLTVRPELVPPDLRIALDGDRIRLFWDEDIDRFDLEVADVLGGAWVKLDEAAVRDGSSVTVRLLPGTAPRFYRLTAR